MYIYDILDGALIRCATNFRPTSLQESVIYSFFSMKQSHDLPRRCIIAHTTATKQAKTLLPSGAHHRKPCTRAHSRTENTFLTALLEELPRGACSSRSPWPCQSLAPFPRNLTAYLKSFLRDMFFSLSLAMTLPTAISKSSCVTCTRRSRSAYMPASVQTALISAPLAPGSFSAIFERSMPRIKFIFREWIFKMSARAPSLGLGNSILRSIRPGLHISQQGH